MAYGLQVNASNGTPRIYETSWFMTYLQDYSYTVGPGATKNVYISGFDPSRWGVVNLRVEPTGVVANAGEGVVSLHNGYVKLRNLGSYENIVFKFTVLKGM